jgi:hypothetical protein
VFDTFYDTVDPECQRIRKPLIRKENFKEFIKEFKERQPKENIRKEVLKENAKENLGKEITKERSPKENKDIREFERKPIREIDIKGIREVPDFGETFIPHEIRPDLADAALNLEPDVAELRAELLRRTGGLGGGGFQ